MLKKNALKQQDAYDAVGADLKRILGWNSQLKTWNALEQSPIYGLANSDLFSNQQDQFVETYFTDWIPDFFLFISVTLV